MKKIVSLFAVTAAMAGSAHAGVILSDNFDSYTTGNLVGQGGWTQTSTVSTNQIQVTGGALVIGSTGGQDIYNGLGTLSTASGSILEADFSLDMVTPTTTATTGDYFFHFGTTLGGTSGFYGKVFAKTDALGNLYLGLSTLSTSTITYGAALTEGVAHTISLIYSFNGGIGLDTLALSVDGNSYATYTSLGADTAPNSIVEANVRQGTSGNYPSLTLDNLVVSYTAAVPEPATFAIMGLGAAFLGLRRRHKLA